MKHSPLFGVILMASLLASCGLDPASQSGDIAAELPVNGTTDSNNTGHLLHDYAPRDSDGLINVVVEIPTGTLEKWEVNEDSGELELEKRNGTFRKVAYLGYPGNYGMVPGTLLSEEEGGDGDPIDVLVLGPALERGAIVQCKLIGMLELLDGGEQDDKLIAVRVNTIFADIDGMEELNAEFNGISEIIQIWFENYKGRGVIEIIAYRDKDIAEEVLNSAIRAYQEDNNDVIKE